MTDVRERGCISIAQPYKSVSLFSVQRSTQGPWDEEEEVEEGRGLGLVEEGQVIEKSPGLPREIR